MIIFFFERHVSIKLCMIVGSTLYPDVSTKDDFEMIRHTCQIKDNKKYIRYLTLDKRLKPHLFNLRVKEVNLAWPKYKGRISSESYRRISQ